MLTGSTTTSRRFYAKAELRLLAGAPGALARPPNLLAAVDRARHRGNVSPERGVCTKTHKNPKQRHSSHAQPCLSGNQKWKPKSFESGRMGSHQAGLSSRHWDHAGAANHADEDSDEPEWADDPVDFSENFDFSQATLERDRGKPVETFIACIPAPVPTSTTGSSRSRFVFATQEDETTECFSPPVSNVLSTYAPSPRPHIETNVPELIPNPVPRSRFKFVETSEFQPSEKPLVARQQSETRSRFGDRVENSNSDATSSSIMKSTSPSPSVSHAPHDHQPPTPTLPKGKSIEVAEMFQMFALANGLRPTPTTPLQPPPPPTHLTSPYHPSRPLQNGTGMHQLRPTGAAGQYHPVMTPLPTTASHHPIPHTILPAVPIRPLTIAGLGQTPQVQHQQQQQHPQQIHPLAQTATTRSKSNPNENRRKGQEESHSRPKPPVPAESAPPAYVRSYMNMHVPQQPSSSGYYAPPGMPIPPHFFAGPYPPPPPPHAPYR